MSSNHVAIQVTNLKKTYGEIKAVQGVNFDVRQGEIFSLLDPNGAGKTTTISMLSTLLRPDNGDALIMGHSIRHVHILIGHYLAIFVLILGQFITLILFGQLVLKIDYLREPLAILTVAGCSALCIAALGLLIGVMAQSEEQAVIFSLVPMFLLAGLGGAWVPLEVTGEVFQSIGHLSPVAWAMDGFKNISIRGLGFESVLLPACALIGYGALFFFIATLRFRTSEER